MPTIINTYTGEVFYREEPVLTVHSHCNSRIVALETEVEGLQAQVKVLEEKLAQSQRIGLFLSAVCKPEMEARIAKAQEPAKKVAVKKPLRRAPAKKSRAKKIS